jgi:hypothetical protein
MAFEIDPDKPDIPALARILSIMGMLCLMGSIISLLISFSGYAWVNEVYALAGAVGAFLLALLFVGQAKTLELLAVVSARLKSRFAIEALTKQSIVPPSPAPASAPARPAQQKERVIHVPDDQARQQGFKVR